MRTLKQILELLLAAIFAVGWALIYLRDRLLDVIRGGR